jgi:hypothetical protein
MRAILIPMCGSKRRRLRAFAGAGVLSAGVLLSSCATSGYQYLHDADTRTYFKVPERWTVFDQRQLFPQQAATPAAPASPGASPQDPMLWAVGFDGDPHPSLQHIMDAGASYPQGVALVIRLDDQQRDAFSLGALRNALFPLDQIYSQTPSDVELVSSEDLVVGGGLRGSHLVYTLRRGGDSLTVDQTGLVDADTQNVYVFAIGCASDCYEENAKMIEQIVRSWTVKAPS